MSPTKPVADAQDAYRAGDLDEAEAILGEALRGFPDDLGANVLFGIVSARRGNRAVAISHLQRALRLDGRCYEAHVALSTLLFADGQPELAIVHGEKAIALDPSDPETVYHLARDLIAHGQTEKAIPYLRRALKLAPSNPTYMQDLAAALTETGQLAASREVWKTLTRIHPGFITGWLKLGGIALAAKEFREAFRCGRKATLIDPSSADAHILIGLALMGEGGAQAAEPHLSQALALRPNEVVSNSAYGLALQEMGRFEEARPYFEKTIELCPTNGQAYYSLIRTKRMTDKDRALVEKLTRHLDDPAASILDRSYMHYALGKAREDLGEYEAAIGSYDEATRLATKAWFANRPPDRKRYADTIQATIDTFTPATIRSLSRKGIASQKPLLVVGMIRSGTTLVEQILSSHPQIKGAGELSFWHDKAGRAFKPNERQIDEEALGELAREYLALLERLGPGSDRVTDKLPHNYTMLGFILAGIPTARVIYVKRHPIDNCLSIYTTAYQHPPALTLSRENIVFSYREHERIMNHWRGVLTKDQLLEVSYEELVANREEVTRRMIAFAGLEWHDACLHHERNERSVNTPSVWQVRQPVYRTSVERWRRFAPWIAPFDELA